MKSSVACVLAVASLLTVLPGCGGSKPVANKSAELSEDQKAILSLVGSFADFSSSLPRLKTMYAKANAPKAADVNKYKGCSFSILGEIVVSGDTATAPVEIIKTDEATGNSSPPVTQTWKFTKEDGQWKLVESPV